MRTNAGRALVILGAIVGLFPTATTHAGTIAYYRFEGNLTDSTGNASHNGTVLAGSPGFSSSVPVNPVPQTGAPNTESLSLKTTDATRFSYPFPFASLTNATLEFWVNSQLTGPEGDIFWTTTGGGDANRFNMGVTSGGSFFVDYREPNGSLHQLGSVPGAAPNGQWTFLTVEKQNNTYSIYVNGVLESTVTDVSPNLPTSTEWTLNGRMFVQPSSCCQFNGLLDELRLSDTALSPSQFLDVSPTTAAAPEPGTLLLLGSALAGLGIAVWRRGRS